MVCEGMGLEEVWDQLKGGHGAAGQRTWVSREMGFVWCGTGWVSWSSHGRNCGGEIQFNPLCRGKEEGACLRWDEGN